MFGEQPTKRIKTVNRTQSFNDDSFVSGVDSDGEGDVEFELGEDVLMAEEELIDQQFVWQYNPLLATADNGMEIANEEEGLKDDQGLLRYNKLLCKQIKQRHKRHLCGKMNFFLSFDLNDLKTKIYIIQADTGIIDF